MLSHYCRRFFFLFLLTAALFTFQPFSEANETKVLHLDPFQTGSPISPYIYGQFIEHFGNCIDTGLWAEIVRDRKFFDPVNSPSSPWKSSGAELVMDETNPFTGKWTPVLNLNREEPGFLKQGPLQFRSNVDFEGYLWVSPSEGIQRIEISLVSETSPATAVWSADSGDFVPNEYQKLPFSFQSNAKEPFDAEIQIRAEGTGSIHIGTLSLMPADNINGCRADTIECLKELDAPVYRWPGGNFVSGYDWKDGIGDRDRRPPRKNPAWPGIEMNDFGFDEFMDFCAYMRTEPYIAVNTGDGNAESALEELEYGLGSPDTPFGKLRAENGHRRPYAIRFWGIGNEMYGNWQIGHMPVEEYIKKNNEFADAFHAAYPSLYLIGVGNAGPWNKAFIPGTFGHINSLSEHFYCGKDGNLNVRVYQIANEIKRIAEAHRRYRNRWPDLYENGVLPVAMDEWNYAGGKTIFGQAGVRFDLADGLGTAIGLHEFFRNSDLFFMANYAQTINVLGAVKTTPVAAELESTGLVLALYRKVYGSYPIAAWLKTEEGSPAGTPVETAAAVTRDLRFLTISLVNTSDQNQTISLDLSNIKLGNKVELWRISDREGNPTAFNNPGTEKRIRISEERLILPKNKQVQLPPYSISILKLPIKEN